MTKSKIAGLIEDTASPGRGVAVFFVAAFAGMGFIVLAKLSALSQADAVVYDALIDSSILAAAGEAAQMHFAGKRGGSKESGAPPVPGRRTNAIRFPSGDQRGDRSRANAGASHVIGVLSFVNTPMNA